MRFLLLLAATIALALGLGAWSADRALDAAADLGTETVGPWSANPMAGSGDADPYSKARLARIGNLTLGIGEGIQFRASRDSKGETLRLDCAYRISGQTPPARVWTLAAFGLDGRVVQPGTARPAWLVSRNILRAEDNSFTATVGPRAASGNWLSVSGNGPFVLTLTLYDTPASSSSGLGDLEMPGLVREECTGG